VQTRLCTQQFNCRSLKAFQIDFICLLQNFVHFFVPCHAPTLKCGFGFEFDTAQIKQKKEFARQHNLKLHVMAWNKTVLIEFSPSELRIIHNLLHLAALPWNSSLTPVRRRDNPIKRQIFISRHYSKSTQPTGKLISSQPLNTHTHTRERERERCGRAWKNNVCN
jgi:hypothetical protein